MINDEFDFTDTPMLRKKAEEKLLEHGKSTSGFELEVDFKKLLHELQVHQVELEMQNEELVKAYTNAEAALKKYTMLYDLAPIGFFILNEDGSISDLNFTGAEMLGEKRFTLLEKNFKFFVAKDSLQDFNHFIDKVYATNTKINCELNLGYDDKPLGFVYLEGIVTGEDQKCQLSVINHSMLRKYT